MFDLAGIASNALFAPEQDRELLLGISTASRSLAYSHAAMKCASLLREAMWSMVSAISTRPASTTSPIRRRTSTRQLSQPLRQGPGMSLPSHAEIVVIGGGIIGCSTAYHLARDHKADVLLIEQGS
jgi:NADPH-dependent 2,4-dienoyl-CoA reductase/sulfur reductase-like enzyme